MGARQRRWTVPHSVLRLSGALVSLGPASAQLHDVTLDPRTYASPSGEYELFVDPSQRTGGGEGRYRFARNGLVLWTGTRSWTLREAEVTDDGLVAGYAYGAGGRAGEDASLTVVLLESTGAARLEERTMRAGVASCTEIPEPMVNGFFLDTANDRLVVRAWPALSEPDGWKKGECW